MEQLTISIPEAKSAEVRAVLVSMGILVDGPKKLDMDAYQQKIANISVWSDEDLKIFEDNRSVLNQFKPQEW